jgi:hypothetical protein
MVPKRWKLGMSLALWGLGVHNLPGLGLSQVLGQALWRKIMIDWQSDSGLPQLMTSCNLPKCTTITLSNYSHPDERFQQEAGLHHPKRQ